MTTLEFKVSLPDQLAEEAKRAGLLRPEAIESMLRERLRQQSAAELRDAMDKMAASGEAEVPMEEIVAAVKAYRQERRRAAGS